MKKLITLVLVALLTLSMTACGNGGKKEEEPTGPITITFWHTLTDQHLEALNKIIDGFNKSQSEIVVVGEQKPYTDYDSNLAMALRNGNGPDFVSRYATDAVEYLADDLIVDMTPYIEKEYGSMENWKNSMIGETYEECTQLGGAYLFPISSSSQVYFYNKTLFDELNLKAPTTWDELLYNAKVCYEHTGKAGFSMDDELDDFQDIMTQRGFTYIDMDKKEIGWPKEETTKLLQWYVDNCKSGYFTLKETNTYCSVPFASGELPAYIGSSAGASYALMNDGKFEAGIAPIPQEGTHKYIPNWGGGYVIFKTTDAKQEACFKFLNYYASAEVSAAWAAGFNTIPSYKAAYDTAIYKEYAANDLAAKAMTEQADCMGWLRACPGSNTVRYEIQKMIRTAVLDGENVSVEQAVETFYANTSAALKGN